MIGTVVGKLYEIVYLLGSGGFGQAFLARKTGASEDIWLVVKQLKPLINPLSTITWEDAKIRFYREAEILKELAKHDKIPNFVDYFEENNQLYLVQEFIDGYELSHELENFIFTENQVVLLLKDLLETLDYIQSHQVIHRDITPENLIRRRQDNNLVFIDFGAIKRVLIEQNNVRRFTNTLAIGKEAYMPDEQANGRPYFCSDIYAIGVIGIQAYINEIPTRDYDSGELMWQHRVTISSHLRNVLEKMTKCYFRERYQTAAEVLIDLSQLLNINTVTTIQPRYRYNYAKLWYKRGNELKNLGYQRQAISLYKKSLEVNSRYYKSWFNMGISWLHLKVYQEARNCFEQAISVKKSSAQAWFHKGICLYNLELYEEAISVFREVITIKPYYAPAWLYISFTLRQTNKLEEASTAYEKASKFRPSYAQFAQKY